MANDASTTLILQSSVIQSETFHDILINGFEYDGNKYENPFRYYEDNKDLVILDEYTASGDIRWSIFDLGEYLKSLLKHLQSLDADMVLIIKEVDEGGLFANLFIYHEDKEVPFHFAPSKFSSQEDLFLAFASCEQTALKFIKHMKTPQRY